MANIQEKDERIQQMLQRFIDVANQLQQEGQPPELINVALMLASGTWATYLAAGNHGYLEESGVLKVSSAFQHNLKRLQEIKKSQFNPDDAK